MPQFKRIRVIANPAAGQNVPVIADLNAAFHGLDWDLRITHDFGDGAKLAREALEEGADLIVAYGGDGTANDVTNGLHPSDVPLAVLAGGTGNGIVLANEIPRNTRKAAEQIAKGAGEIRAVDLGQIGDHLFLLRVDIGVIVDAADTLSRETKERFGLLSYIYATINSLTTADDYQWQLTIDGRNIETSGAACMISNMTGMGLWNPKIRDLVKPEDGQFDLFMVRAGLGTVAEIIATITNLADLLDAFEHYQGSEIRLEVDPPKMVYVDGEPLHETPVTLKILPQALNLFVPYPE